MKKYINSVYAAFSALIVALTFTNTAKAADPIVDVQILNEYKQVIPRQADGAANMLPNSKFYVRVLATTPDHVGIIYARVNNAANNASIACDQRGWWQYGFGSNYYTPVVDFGPYNVGPEFGGRQTWVHVANDAAGDFQWSGNGWGSKTSWDGDVSLRCTFPNVVSSLATGKDPAFEVEILDSAKKVLAENYDGYVDMLPNTMFYLRVKARCPRGIGMFYSRINNAADTTELQPGAYAQIGWWESGFTTTDHINATYDFGPYNVGSELGLRKTWVHVQSEGAGAFQWSGNGWTSKTSWASDGSYCAAPNVVASLPTPVTQGPTNLTADVMSPTMIRLSWTPYAEPMTAFAKYYLERRVGDNSWRFIAELPTTDSTFTQSGGDVRADMIYVYRIRTEAWTHDPSPYSTAIVQTPAQ